MRRPASGVRSPAYTGHAAELYDLTVSRVYALAGSSTRSPAGAEMVTENVYWEVRRQASLRQAMGALRGLLAADSP